MKQRDTGVPDLADGPGARPRPRAPAVRRRAALPRRRPRAARTGSARTATRWAAASGSAMIEAEEDVTDELDRRRGLGARHRRHALPGRALARADVRPGPRAHQGLTPCGSRPRGCSCGSRRSTIWTRSRRCSPTRRSCGSSARAGRSAATARRRRSSARSRTTPSAAGASGSPWSARPATRSGCAGLILWPDIDGAEELEVAYLLARDAWGTGLRHRGRRRDPRPRRRRSAPTRPVSLIYPDNAASIRVAEKNGMVLREGRAVPGPHAAPVPSVARRLNGPVYAPATPLAVRHRPTQGVLEG